MIFTFKAVLFHIAQAQEFMKVMVVKWSPVTTSFYDEFHVLVT